MEPKLTKDEKKALRQEDARERMEREKKQALLKAIGIWVIGGILLILALWALIIFSSSTQSQTATSNIQIPAVTKSDYQSSSTGAKATLVEYADFQCPTCKAYYPIIKQLQSYFGNTLNVVYRFFPLKTIHQNALNAAKAAYAAGLQGKFWQMHDQLFVTQDSWATYPNPESTFISYAKQLGLDTTQFQKDYESSEADTVVNNAYASDIALGLNGTPTFFLNGKLIENPQSYQDFQNVIQNVLK